MRERPILFSGPMIRALLNGSKTQTRRVVKPQPDSVANWHTWSPVGYKGVDVALMWKCEEEDLGRSRLAQYCPYGVPGDRLWVRETFSLEPEGELGIEGAVVYRADGQDDLFKWKPSIFMPRRVSRITLEITGVRCERLNDISDPDAKAEGVSQEFEFHGRDRSGDLLKSYTYIRPYRNLWDKINAKKHPWESNPYVWVLEFKRVEA